MQTLLKWAGGKGRELKFILPQIPSFIDNYYEPFFGGGAVYFSLDRVNSCCYVNDASKELINFYKSIKNQNVTFFEYLNQLNSNWECLTEFFHNDEDKIVLLYNHFYNDTKTETDVKNFINSTSLNLSMKLENNEHRRSVFQIEIDKSLLNKFKRTKSLEIKKGRLPDEDLRKIFLSALKSAYYTFVRELYNYPKKFQVCKQEFNAVFLFIRMYCYSGMFRYNASGKFNVPYGGIGYNNNSMTKKIDYYSSLPLVKKFKKTQFENLDFEQFLSSKKLSRDDFIFLDPPYDTEFSTYAQNEFGRNDQIRLANYLINDAIAKWMLVIKSTDFIVSLYKNKNLNISSVDKKYNVSFMDRNIRDVTHLIIRNY
ncbi:MAG: hypothetical protein CMD68_04945 [Gammaproteobacteria bacterium]|nr:hypothetical protein [Gammaproteobacteria bacterium]